MIGQTIHEEQTKAILVANRAIISNWTLAVGDDGLGFAFAMPVGVNGNAFTEMGWDRVRILLMNKFKGRLEQCGYTARDIPILFEHFDLDANGELGREVSWGLGRTCRWLRCRSWSPPLLNAMGPFPCSSSMTYL